MNIFDGNLAGKTILEVGSGRGDTTCKLVDFLSGQPSATLLVADISDTFFKQLNDEFEGKGVQVRFIRTGACELRGIPDNSVDYLVCNYTLCAVNAQAGSVVLALQKFYQVLKIDGQLFVEEEFPINKRDTPAQDVWAEKWRILKSATMLADRFPYNEIDPEVLEGLCRLVGFQNIQRTVHTEVYPDTDVLNFFQRRLERLLPELPNDNLRAGFIAWASELRDKAIRSGGMEIPFYRLTATK